MAPRKKNLTVAQMTAITKAAEDVDTSASCKTLLDSLNHKELAEQGERNLMLTLQGAFDEMGIDYDERLYPKNGSFEYVDAQEIPMGDDEDDGNLVAYMVSYRPLEIVVDTLLNESMRWEHYMDYKVKKNVDHLVNDAQKHFREAVVHDLKEATSMETLYHIVDICVKHDTRIRTYFKDNTTDTEQLLNKEFRDAEIRIRGIEEDKKNAPKRDGAFKPILVSYTLMKLPGRPELVKVPNKEVPAALKAGLTVA